MITPSRPSNAGKWIVAGVAVILVATAALVGWNWYGSEPGGEWGQVVRSPASVDGKQSEPNAATLTARDVTAAPPPLPRLAGVPRFTTALARGPDGALWVGSEDDGIVRYDPRTNAGRTFRTRDGLGDDTAYALAVDRLGRIWAGHLNHGVSVYNGNAQGRWQNYEVVGGLSRMDSLSGPVGERVFDIAVCPTDGDVWIATNCGLSRYSEQTRTWAYRTRLDGLPSDDIAAIAFDAGGRLYAATNAHGLAFADAAGDYQNWTSVRGADRPPLTAEGDGLPTDLLNDVIVARNVVYVATTTGLAFSSDRGTTWRHLRGKDWADKVRHRRGGPPAGWEPAGRAVLSDDFCNNLSFDEVRDTLWVGHPGGPVETFDLRKGVKSGATSVPGGHWPKAMLMPQAGGPPVVTVAGYGDGDGGLWRTPAVGKIDNSKQIESDTKLPPAGGPPALPAAAAPVSADALAALAKRVAAASAVAAVVPPKVAVLNDDWRTQGSWLGRYGKYWACLSAMDRNDYVWGATPKPIAYERELGPGFPHNYVQFWRHTLYTDNPKSLEMPRVWFDWLVREGRSTWATDRRQSDWNDAGEQYPATQDGPDLYVTVDVPPGEFTLSLYDHNKDGHDISSAYRGRDMTVSIFHRPAGSPLQFVRSGAVYVETPVVRRRLRDFWGGLYQRFYVRGPAVVTVGCRRVFSPNLMLSAVLLDTPEQRPAPFAAPLTVQPSVAEGWPPVFAPGRVVLDTESERVHLAAVPSSMPTTAVPDLETCQFSLWQFAAWERSQESRAVATIRSIEHALRWDGVRTITKGEGFEILKAHLAKRPD